MARRKVLALRTSDDPEVFQVGEALKGRQADLIAFDTDEFPTDSQVWLRCDATSEEVVLQSARGRVAFSELSAIWLRHLDTARRLPETMEDRYRGAVRQESQATLLGLTAVFRGRVLDPYPNMRRAADKLRQLQLARELGFEIPRTLVTNETASVRTFADACSGNVVTKALTEVRVRVGDEEQFLYTNEIAHHDLDDLEGLRVCPMAFQERLPKELEIRATVVGRRVFATAVDSQATELGTVDWRREGMALNPNWQRYRLPSDVAERLVSLVKSFGLTYSAADLILTPQGRYVFLESNPAGEWFWLDSLLNLGIVDALADELLVDAPGH